MEDRKILYNNIRRILRRKEMTQGELAAMAGVRREYINKIINRKITPTVPLGIRIADALDSSVKELFSIGR